MRRDINPLSQAIGLMSNLQSVRSPQPVFPACAGTPVDGIFTPGGGGPNRICKRVLESLSVGKDWPRAGFAAVVDRGNVIG
jgi:hypothetical protein